MTAPLTAIQEHTAELVAALRTVGGARYHEDLGATVNPPASILGPPSFMWETGVPFPTSARFLVYVIVAFGPRAVEQLVELVPIVAVAIEGLTDAVMIRADPGVYPSGGVDLPAYELQVEVSL